MTHFVFDFHLQHQIHAADRLFQLNVCCQSTTKRLAIIGQSGSGKSLTLRLLAGLEVAQQSLVRIHQQCYADSRQGFYLPASQREVGLVFQDYALFPHLTIAQNIAFGLHRQWLNPPKLPCEQTQFWLEKMQLNAIAQHYPHQISGGEKQRTALARACITHPKWLLLDEPFCALDTNLRQQMRELVMQLQQELDVPLLLVSHDPADTEILADEIWTMEDGVLTQSSMG